MRKDILCFKITQNIPLLYNDRQLFLCVDIFVFRLDRRNKIDRKAIWEYFQCLDLNIKCFSTIFPPVLRRIPPPPPPPPNVPGPPAGAILWNKEKWQ